MKRILAVVALGVTVVVGVEACGTGGPATSAPGPSAAPTDNTRVAREIAAITVGGARRGSGGRECGDEEVPFPSIGLCGQLRERVPG